MLIQVFFHKIQQFYQVDPKIKQLSSVSFNENRLILANGSTSIKFWIYEDKTNKSKINIPRPFGQLLSTMMNYFSKWEIKMRIQIEHENVHWHIDMKIMLIQLFSTKNGIIKVNEIKYKIYALYYFILDLYIIFDLHFIQRPSLLFKLC